MSKSKNSTESAVLQYLTSQNRPYSVNDIVLNLHKEHGKTAVQKALDTLVEVCKNLFMTEQYNDNDKHEHVFQGFFLTCMF